MAVDQVSARAVQSLASSVSQDTAGLREGSLIDGRVIAINPDESLKVATRYGQFDVDQSQISGGGGGHGHGRAKLPLASEMVGTAVKLEVTGQNSATARLILRLIGGAESSPDFSQDAALSSPEAESAARVATEVAHAAARQDGLAPVFADAQQLSASADQLPAGLSRILQEFNAFALNGEETLSAQDIQAAVSASGLFLEAKLARWASLASKRGAFFGLDPDVSLTSQDLKAALFGLKSAVDAWIGETAMGETGDGDQATDAVPATAQDTLRASSDFAAAGSTEATVDTKNATPFDTEALFAVLRPPPLPSAAPPVQILNPGAGPNPAPTSAQSARPDLVTMATIGEWMEQTGQAAMISGGRRSAYGGRQAVSGRAQGSAVRADASLFARPPPPRRGSLPIGQAATVSQAISVSPLDLARGLSQKASNALARISLGQYASLPEKHVGNISVAGHSPSSPSHSPTSWLFELPLKIGGKINIAQFEIDQIQSKAGAGEVEVPAWRVQFSLDIAPGGLVHARLVLADRHLSVGLWAEDRSMGVGLHGGLIHLRRALETAGFLVDEIHLASGRPPSGPPAQAGGFFDRNA